MCVAQLATYYCKTHSLGHEGDHCFKAATNTSAIKCWLSEFDSSWCEINMFPIIIVIDSSEVTESRFCIHVT